MLASRRLRMPARALIAAFGLLDVLIAVPAHAAWDRSDPLPASIPAHFDPRGLSTADDTGYWAIGTVASPNGFGARGAVARFRNDGSSAWLSYTDLPTQVIGAGAGEALTAGAVTEPLAVGCRLSRWSGAGSRLWTVVADPTRSCRTLVSDGAGGAWVTVANASGAQQAMHVLADGEIRNDGSALEVFAAGRYELAADPDGGGLYAVGQQLESDQQGARVDAAIVAIDRNGHLRWQRLVPSPEPTGSYAFEAVAVGRDGHLYVAGHTSATLTPRIASFTRDGQSRFDRPLSVGVPPNSPTLVLRPADTGVHLIAGDRSLDGGVVAALHVGPDGSVLQANGFGDVRLSDATLASTSREGRRLLFAATTIQASATYTTLCLVDEDLPSRQFMPVVGAPLGVTLPADGSVVLARSTVLPGYTGLLRFDDQGNPLDTPDLEIGAVAIATLGVGFGEDGSTYRVTASPDHSGGKVEKIGPDGRLAWSERLDATLLGGSAILSVSAGQVCSAFYDNGSLLIDCRETMRGAALFQHRIARAASDSYLTGLQVLAAGDVLVWYWIPGGVGSHLLRLAAGGAVRYDVRAVDFPAALALGKDGSAAVLGDIGLSHRMRTYDGTGGLRIDRDQTAGANLRLQRLFDAGNGRFVRTYQLARTEGPGYATYASLFDVQRGDLWTTQLANDLDVFDLRFTDAALVLLAVAPDRRSTILVSIDRGDGHVRWQYSQSDPLTAQRQLALDPLLGDVAVAIEHAPQGLRVLALRGADGHVLSDRTESCGMPSCGLAALIVDPDRRVRLLATGTDTLGTHATVFQLGALFQPAPPLPLGQQAISGAWYPDYASGQGLVFDYIASAGVLFAPWFTYQPTRVDDASGQHWYSLQGTLAPGATEADLDILENSGGQLATPPITLSRRVGIARVHLEACDRMALDYGFDFPTQNGASGRLTLTRLTAPLAVCTGSGATSTAAAATTGDPRQSGSWFTPALSGQGFMFTFQPGREMFGAWFTYDPDGAADDPAAQHWFTLQGDPAAGTSAPLTATLYQTLGGGFDREPTANTRRVGRITLNVQACDRITVDYQFDTSDVAGRYAGKSGSLPLEKIGGCNP